MYWIDAEYSVLKCLMDSLSGNLGKISFLFLVLTFLLLPFSANGEIPASIHKLKKLYVNTVIIDKGKPKAVIVVPSNKRYSECVELIQDKIFELTGVRLPVISDTVIPKKVLSDRNVIALGNMIKNRFIEQLYRQWYCLLDLKYPGRGGYVVRSLHNPYGTGHNVILIGGSDDLGVNRATAVFIKLLKPGNPFRLGWTMKIKLGKGVHLPMLDVNSGGWKVFSWRDSWRRTKNGRTTGYKPCTFFGWNPISTAGILYYMTGKRGYLECFKGMAMPSRKYIPKINRTNSAFYDPLNPLVKNEHYRSHLVDCVWDLIEESPLFTNKERLFITNKLLEHQWEYYPSGKYCKLNGSRHDLWRMLNIYTGSRYFLKYYPDPVWKKRIQNVRRAFDSFINNPTWGERDTLYWVSTSIEPVFDFFMLDGFKKFVQTGAARTMMLGLQALMTGRDIDDYNRYVSINLLHKAGYILNDNRYYWMARNLGFDFDVFRIGQSYWPAESLQFHPPNDLVDKITVAPLARTDWERVMTSVPLSQAFQVLSYRTGLKEKDDYFLLDGFCGLGRNPYHLNTIYNLRMFNGKELLKGYGNDVDIWLNGMVNSNVPRAAALKKTFCGDGLAFVKTVVPNMTASCWERYLLYLKNKAFIVIDRVEAKKTGAFDITCSWQLVGKTRTIILPSYTITTRSGVRLSSAEFPISSAGGLVQGKISRKLESSQTIIFANIISTVHSPKSIYKIDKGAYLIKGRGKAFTSVNSFASGPISVEAEFAYIGQGLVFLSNAKSLSINGNILFQTNLGVDLVWHVKEHTLIIDSADKCSVIIPAAKKENCLSLDAGRHVLNLAGYRLDLPSEIIRAIGNLKIRPRTHPVSTSRGRPPELDWQAVWTLDLKKKITHLGISKSSGDNDLWVAAQEKSGSYIFKVSLDGKILKTIRRKAKILCFWPAKDQDQASAFALLVGYKDDYLEAFSKEGKSLWRVKTRVHRSFRKGDHYIAPWFTDPNPPYNMTGVYSILVGDIWNEGKEEIVIGRPCTVEFRELDGGLIARVATRWGNNTSLSILRKRGGKPPLLLVGKAFTGRPGITGINCHYKNVSDNMFSSLPSGYTSMHAWHQRGLNHMIASDINGDGVEEVVYTLTGHWNELRVYDGATGKPLWVQYFGPGRRGMHFITGLKAVDVEGDGSKEIIAATKEGWVCAFDDEGQQIWRYRFENDVECMDISGLKSKLVFVLKDGFVYLLDNKGSIEKRGLSEAPIEVALASNDCVFIGTRLGALVNFMIK